MYWCLWTRKDNTQCYKNILNSTFDRNVTSFDQEKTARTEELKP